MAGGRERLHRVDIVCPALKGPRPVLVVFEDPHTGAPRRTLPLTLQTPHTQINGFALRGDERAVAIPADGAGGIEVRLSPRGGVYRAARAVVAALTRPREGPARRFDPAPLAARLPPPLPDPPLVSVIIPTRDRADLLARSVETAVFAAAYPSVELIILDNGSRLPETLALLDRWRLEGQARVLRHDAPFNFAALNNLGAAAARGEVLVLLNNDVEGIEPHWLTRLVARCLQPGVGAVGARLLYPTGGVQHIGMALGAGGLVSHFGVGAPAEDAGPEGAWRRARPVAAVTGACLAVRRATYAALGGLDEGFAVEFNDVDFCLRAEAAGLQTWMEPDCVLIHHESLTRGRGRPSAQVMAEQIAFIHRWGPRIAGSV